jgi:hypothetical protein
MKRSNNKLPKFNENTAVSKQVEYIEESLENISAFLEDDEDTLKQVNTQENINANFINNRIKKITNVSDSISHVLLLLETIFEDEMGAFKAGVAYQMLAISEGLLDAKAAKLSTMLEENNLSTLTKEDIELHDDLEIVDSAIKEINISKMVIQMEEEGSTSTSDSSSSDSSSSGSSDSTSSSTGSSDSDSSSCSSSDSSNSSSTDSSDSSSCSSSDSSNSSSTDSTYSESSSSSSSSSLSSDSDSEHENNTESDKDGVEDHNDDDAEFLSDGSNGMPTLEQDLDNLVSEARTHSKSSKHNKKDKPVKKDKRKRNKEDRHNKKDKHESSKSKSSKNKKKHNK